MGTLEDQGMRVKREQERDSLLLSFGKVARSHLWPALREKHIRLNPYCKACGSKQKLEVHHRLPYSLYLEKELDPSNLMTLCCDGPGGIDCHLLWGHCGDWRAYNPKVEHYSAVAKRMLAQAIRGGK